jgi:hypothetical protein
LVLRRNPVALFCAKATEIVGGAGRQPSSAGFDFGHMQTVSSVAEIFAAEINGLWGGCPPKCVTISGSFSRFKATKGGIPYSGTLVTFFGFKESNTKRKPFMTLKSLLT